MRNTQDEGAKLQRKVDKKKNKLKFTELRRMRISDRKKGDNKIKTR